LLPSSPNERKNRIYSTPCQSRLLLPLTS
jgi:hypothetical protein